MPLSRVDAAPTAGQTGSIVPFDPHRFRSAATHYLAGRPPYADRLIRHVAQFCGLSDADHVLDLGCGPGQLARALAPFVRQVTAIDPEPEMLAAAGKLAQASGISNVTFTQGSSLDLGPHLGRFNLVSIGRAFHWMDRVETLRRLDQMIEPGGAVVLFDDKHPPLPENAWLGDFEALHERYSGQDCGRRIRKGPDWLPHEVVLLKSAFPVLDRVSALDRHPLTIDRLINRVLSRSSTTSARLGEKTAAMAEDLGKLLAQWGKGGILQEVVETRALIARRA
ncbi:class I SAM-dependent methyltransferase [Dongia soli]|uniref:Class I SAM-dependent methyltransferase n=1 Tax=Dongia soli TaxID=600628 RepID=A0ABU5ED63_9PROT|nr:class I SAM-dependent methyltransferase [Dongia soli]MDY0884305.1 class I SAM-dependent methyltransferase [Dongia soli]